MKSVQQQKRARDLTPEDRAEIIRNLEFGSSLNEILISEMARSSVPVCHGIESARLANRMAHLA